MERKRAGRKIIGRGSSLLGERLLCPQFLPSLAAMLDAINIVERRRRLAMFEDGEDSSQAHGRRASGEGAIYSLLAGSGAERHGMAGEEGDHAEGLRDDSRRMQGHEDQG